MQKPKFLYNSLYTKACTFTCPDPNTSQIISAGSGQRSYTVTWWLSTGLFSTYIAQHSDGFAVTFSQTTLSFMYIWKKKGLVNVLHSFCSTNSTFWGFYMWLLIGVKGQKSLHSLWPGWQYRVIISLSPINKPFLSFNTNQKSCIKFPKSGDV